MLLTHRLPTHSTALCCDAMHLTRCYTGRRARCYRYRLPVAHCRATCPPDSHSSPPPSCPTYYPTLPSASTVRTRSTCLSLLPAFYHAVTPTFSVDIPQRTATTAFLLARRGPVRLREAATTTCASLASQPHRHFAYYTATCHYSCRYHFAPDLPARRVLY